MTGLETYSSSYFGPCITGTLEEFTFVSMGISRKRVLWSDGLGLAAPHCPGPGAGVPARESQDSSGVELDQASFLRTAPTKSVFFTSKTSEKGAQTEHHDGYRISMRSVRR